MLPLDVLVFGIMDLVVMSFVHVVHLVHQVLAIRHKLTHRIRHKVRVQAVRPVVTPLIWYKIKQSDLKIQRFLCSSLSASVSVKTF